MKAQDQGRDQSQAKSFSHKLKIPPISGLYVRKKQHVNNEKYKPLFVPLEPSVINRLKRRRTAAYHRAGKLNLAVPTIT
jgi:hypothetical protein